jgi:hypothetical protein
MRVYSNVSEQLVQNRVVARDSGDQVGDTPMKESPAFGCPVAETRARSKRKLGCPINNFMDYSDDAASYFRRSGTLFLYFYYEYCYSNPFLLLQTSV